MKRIVWLVVSMVLSGTIWAQDARVTYVDVAASQTRIQELEQANQNSTQLIERLTQQNTELNDSIATMEGQINEMRPIIARVDGEIAELGAVGRRVVDDELRRRSQEALHRARTIKTGLETNTRPLNDRINAARAQIEANRTQVRIQTPRIEENENSIAFLRAAIERTEAQQRRVDTYIGNVDSILNDADRFLQRNQ